MSVSSRLPAPNITLLVTVSLSVLILVFSLFFVTETPWMGLSFRAPASGPGLVIAKIHEQPSLPGASLRPGDRVLAIEDKTGHGLRLKRSDIVKEPHQLSGHAAYRDFIQRQERIWNLLNSDSPSLLLNDGRRIHFDSLPTRPIHSLPFQYWLINFFGLGVLLIGTTVWIYRSQQVNNRLLVMASIGFALSAFTAAIYSSRELALPGDIFRMLKAANVLGVMVFGYSIVLLLWHYPTRIRPYRFLIPLVYLLVIGLWILETWQLTPSTGLYKYIIVNVLVIILGYIQWYRTRNDPVERAALSWLIMTIVITLTLALLIYYLPILHHGEPIANIATPFGLVFILFFGLTLGVVKYRLFDLQQWWAEVWLWIITGVLILGLDAVLLYILDLSQTPALAISLFSVGWLYFPLRQWLLQRFIFKGEPSLNDHLPVVMESLFGINAEPDPNTRFASILRQVFDPLHIELQEGRIKPAVMDNGLQLAFPAVDGDMNLQIQFKYRGMRLFSRADMKLANSLRSLTITAVNIEGERAKGASLERKRIMRDLHDDVAARLLSLIHASENTQSEKARQALHALRETIYSLDDDSRISLVEFLDDMQGWAREFLDGTEVTLRWKNIHDVHKVSLNPRQRINLSRIFQETVHNALKHSQCTVVEVITSMINNRIGIQVCNDGVKTHQDNWIDGKGLNNIRNRAQEIHGTVQWEVEQETCCFTLDIPVGRD